MLVCFSMNYWHGCEALTPHWRTGIVMYNIRLWHLALATERAEVPAVIVTTPVQARRVPAAHRQLVSMIRAYLTGSQGLKVPGQQHGEEQHPGVAEEVDVRHGQSVTEIF